MATKLRDRELGLVQGGRPKNALHPVRANWPYPAPKRFIVRELSAKIEGGLQFFYKNPGLAKKVPAGGLACAIAEILNPPPMGLIERIVAAAAALVKPKLKQQTPLDLNIHGEPAFVFLRLDPTLNLRFDSDEAAISLKDARVGNHYGGLQYVLEDGTVLSEPAAGCKLVYFAVSPPLLVKGEEYRHGFNFHLELDQLSPSATSEISVLPIIIDPDVGHPGGSDT
jgi:hypothetical protein